MSRPIPITLPAARLAQLEARAGGSRSAWVREALERRSSRSPRRGGRVEPGSATIAVRLPEALLAACQARADAAGVPLASWLRAALEAELDAGG